MLDRANNQIRDLTSKVNRLEPENERLRGVERDYDCVRRALGFECVDKIVSAVKEQETAYRELETAARRQKTNRNYVR